MNVESSRFRDVADRIDKYADKYAPVLAMEQELVSLPKGRTFCRTVACVGGHYAAIKIDEAGKEPMVNLVPLQDNLLTDDEGLFVGYEHGAEQMARDLGFESSDELAEWMHDNPPIWGNHGGHLMFTEPHAWSEPNRPKALQALTLKDVAAKLRAVADRIEADSQIKTRMNQ